MSQFTPVLDVPTHRVRPGPPLGQRQRRPG